MARCDAVVGMGLGDLIIFSLSIVAPRLGKPRLQKTTPATAAVVVGAVGLHLNKVLFTHRRFDYEAKILGYWVSQRFSNQLTRILNGEFNP